MRREQPPLIAVVRLRKRDEWVLPKGKLDAGETPLAAAKREVLEETGHDVTVHEFLGTLVYEISGRSKVVHYWRMEACGGQTHELMHDIRAVDWLPLDAALERLSRTSERAFLANVGPLALLSLSRETKARAQALRKPRGRNVVAPAPLPPISLPTPMPAERAQPEPAMDASMAAEPVTAAIVADAAAAVIQADPAPQTEGREATVAATVPAAVIDAEPAPASPAGAADRADGVVDSRRWSLARKLRDWLGLAA